MKTTGVCTVHLSISQLKSEEYIKKVKLKAPTRPVPLKPVKLKLLGPISNGKKITSYSFKIFWVLSFAIFYPSLVLMGSASAVVEPATLLSPNFPSDERFEQKIVELIISPLLKPVHLLLPN